MEQTQTQAPASQVATKDSLEDKIQGTFGKSRFVHFERGDRIIYEPNELHQLKYINDKGEISPITGVQYILTQPNFSKGRPCHFFVVNKSEFEAATGFKQFSQMQQLQPGALNLGGDDLSK